MNGIPIPTPGHPLAKAVVAGDLATVKELATAAAVNQADDGGFTPLFWAAAAGQTVVADWLLSQGTNVNLPLADGRTSPLAVAVQEGRTAMARLLINRGSMPVMRFPPDFKPKPWAMKFFQDQIAYRARGDWDGIVRDFYTEDAVMVSLDFAVSGREAIKKHFIDGNKAAGKLIVFDIENYFDAENIMALRLTALSENILTKGDDVYWFRDGKVCFYSALMVPSGRTRDWALKYLSDEYLETSIFNPLKGGTTP